MAVAACPGLDELPAAPAGKTGWPWTVADPWTDLGRTTGSRNPPVTIVTPSYNQGRYLEETIRSVLLQGYPNLEYIIIDGGSTDESVDIIAKYARWLAHWVSERDRGQAEALNKGLRHATGEIFQFINSDDLLAPGALRAVAEAMEGADAVAGVVVDFDADGNRTPLACRMLEPVNFITRPSGYLYHQPGVWLRRRLLQSLGGYNQVYRYKFDWELQLRYLERWPRVTYVDDTLAFFRLHPSSKTMSEGSEFWQEELMARDLLVHQVVDGYTRSVLRRLVERRHWRLRVDELVRRVEISRRRAITSLFSEAARDPLNRIDRYSLGALRRLVTRK